MEQKEKFEIKIPSVGESITEAVVGQWSKKNGDLVQINELLLAIETDKASVEIVSERSGILTITEKTGKTLPIGSVVGFLENIEASAERGSASGSGSGSTSGSGDASANGSAQSGRGLSSQRLKEQNTTDGAVLSPAVKKLVSEKGIDPDSFVGSGKDGRLTKGDILLANTKANPSQFSAAVQSANPSQSAVVREFSLSEKLTHLEDRELRVPMTTIRKRTAERLVEAQRTAAILTTFNEIDMSRIKSLRQVYKEDFKKVHQVQLGFMGFFVKALIAALKAWPALNASVDGTDIVYKKYYNIGVAVGTDKGLLVPIIKNVHQKSLAEIEMAIVSFAQKAKDGKISLDDLSGGTFTISNGGTYGSLLSTPILTPPQVGILGMHKIEDRPVVIDGKIEIRPMMYVALSYDHRIVDGKEAVSFLVKVKENVENPERLILEI